jgi:hypothetical protein
MFKLYTDKNNTFKCKVAIEGANESSALTRLIIEGENYNLMFEGSIKDNICEVNIGKFKNTDNFKSKGSMRLEVIADDTYFTPWKSEYMIEQSKTVVVEMIEDKASSKPLVEVKEVSYVQEKSKVDFNNSGENIYNLLIENKIKFKNYENLTEMLKYNSKAKQIIKGYLDENHISGKKLESTLRYLTDKF